MLGRLLMMPSSSQVLDHQLIFHIMYGLRQFYHRQNKGEERRGEIQQKKSNSCLTNIERKRCKKAVAASQTQRIGNVAKIEERGDLTKKQVLLPKKSNNCQIEVKVVNSSSREVVEQQQKQQKLLRRGEEFLENMPQHVFI